VSEFDFKQKVMDGVPLVDLIEILGITVEELIDAFDDKFEERYYELKEYLGGDEAEDSEAEEV
jgi:hypothetical protein